MKCTPKIVKQKFKKISYAIYISRNFIFDLKNQTLNGGIKKEQEWDFPGGPMVKNPPSNAGDAGSIPGRGTKIPHATG